MPVYSVIEKVSAIEFQLLATVVPHALLLSVKYYLLLKLIIKLLYICDSYALTFQGVCVCVHSFYFWFDLSVFCSLYSAFGKLLICACCFCKFIVERFFSDNSIFEGQFLFFTFLYSFYTR